MPTRTKSKEGYRTGLTTYVLQPSPTTGLLFRMMKSESEAALAGDTAVPTYLRAYGSTYRDRRYESIGGRGGDERGEERNGKQEDGFAFRRALAVMSVFIMFAAAVSTASSRWAERGWQAHGNVKKLEDSTYREFFKVFLAQSCLPSPTVCCAGHGYNITSTNIIEFRIYPVVFLLQYFKDKQKTKNEPHDRLVWSITYF